MLQGGEGTGTFGIILGWAQEASLPSLYASALVILLSLICWSVLRGGSQSNLNVLKNQFQEFPILNKTLVSMNEERPVMFLTVGMSTERLPTGAHVKIRAEIGGEEVIRPYTPTKFDENQCELMFRVYPQGKLTQYLYRNIQVGDMVALKGPTGVHRYGLKGPGSFSRGRRQWVGIKYIAMIAGGTGVTPMLQIANHIVNDPNDTTRAAISLFNSTMEDIMLHDRLDELASASQLSMSFFVGRAEEEKLQELRDEMTFSTVSKLSVRRCTQKVLVENILDALNLKDDEDENVRSKTMVCMCGPDGFVKQAKLLLKDQFPNILVW